MEKVIEDEKDVHRQRFSFFSEFGRHRFAVRNRSDPIDTPPPPPNQASNQDPSLLTTEARLLQFIT